MGGIDLNVNLSRSRFEDLINPILTKITAKISAACQQEKFDTIISIGGASNILKFQNMIKPFTKNVLTLNLEETFSNLASEVQDDVQDECKNGTLELKKSACTITLGE